MKNIDSCLSISVLHIVKMQSATDAFQQINKLIMLHILDA